MKPAASLLHIPLATRLVQEGKVLEATRVIQSALLQNDGEHSGGPPHQQRFLNPTIEPLHRTLLPQMVESKSTRGSRFPFRRPLSTSVELLRKVSRKLRVRPDRNAPARDPIPSGATFAEFQFQSHEGSRPYKLYVPSIRTTAPRPLVIMLHGCTQDADDFSLGTGMNLLAEELDFVVAYPEQTSGFNQMKCWNWFNINNQERGRGEPHILAGITSRLIEEQNIDPSHVYIAGFSAGAAMAVVMAATYPELFAGVGVHSGLPYKAASDVPSAFAAMDNTSVGGYRPSTHNHRWPRSIVFHGDRDETVHPANGWRVFEEVSHSGDPEAQTLTLEEAHFDTHQQSTYYSPDGLSIAEHWLIRGGRHAWSGGRSTGTYTASDGPSASREMMRFFLASR
jgi:poly(hydroxyalkanoate) depolymerase family esterase